MNRAKILDALWKVHLRGICPTDFTERNVLVQEGEYRLINFHDHVEHHCQWSFDFLHGTEAEQAALLGKTDTFSALRCDVLFELADEVMEFWDHGMLKLSMLICFLLLILFYRDCARQRTCMSRCEPAIPRGHLEAITSG